MSAMGLDRTDRKRKRDSSIVDARIAAMKERFLVAFAECGIVHTACKWAKINRSTYWKWMQTDPAFAAGFGEAQLKAAQALEDELIRRAKYGISKRVLYKGKGVFVDGRPLYETQYSDVLLIKAMEANHPKYKRENKVEIVQSTNDKLGAELAKILTPKEIEELEAKVAEYNRKRLNPIPVEGIEVKTDMTVMTEISSTPSTPLDVEENELGKHENELAPPSSESPSDSEK